MDPFILNFGVINNDKKTELHNSKYNILHEQKTYIDDQNDEKFVIETSNSYTIIDTGSYITRADTDPTSDESTDR